MHLKRAKLGQDLRAVNRREKYGPMCKIAGCTRKKGNGRFGLCHMHYSRLKRGSDKVHFAQPLNRRGVVKLKGIAIHEAAYRWWRAHAKSRAMSMELDIASALESYASQANYRSLDVD